MTSKQGQSREGRLKTEAEFQSSLRDCSIAHSQPRTTSWATFKRPYGTKCRVLTQTLKP
jgi:hypothetical protein